MNKFNELYQMVAALAGEYSVPLFEIYSEFDLETYSHGA